VNADVAQAFVRLIRHLEQSAIQPEATLSTDLLHSLAVAEKALGIVVNVDKGRVLNALALLAGPS
jgi:hypothetical protein